MPDVKLLACDLRKSLDRILLDAVSDKDDLERLLNRVLKTTVDWLEEDGTLPVDVAALLGVERDERFVLASVGMPEGAKQVSRTIVERTLKEGRLLIAHDLRGDADLGEIESLVQFGARSFVSAPLEGRSGPVGVLYLESRSASLSGDQAERIVEELRVTLTPYLDTIQTHRRSLWRASLASQGPARHGLAGRSDAVRRVLERIAIYGPLDLTVLILGESGTGKELAARALHRERGIGRFLPVEVTSIPPSMLESELFGHKKGAFTGATHDRNGLFISAGEGTLLLDEIGDLSFDLQAKLLRVIQERTVKPVGSDAAMPISARLVLATNRELGADVLTGRFRADLFERIRALEVHLPPLRERIDDLADIVDELLEQAAARLGLSGPCALTEGGMEILTTHDWPGNIRELKGFLERISANTRQRVIRTDQLREELREWRAARPGGGGLPLLPRGGGLNQELERFERELIREALRDAGGVQTVAARSLGIPESTLRRKMSLLGLRRNGEPARA